MWFRKSSLLVTGIMSTVLLQGFMEVRPSCSIDDTLEIHVYE